MAIVQISKIIHRVGANVDLPQLDTGEIGFASDTQRVYIGNDPILVPIPDGGITTQTEILTEVSTLQFAKLEGSSNINLSTDTVLTGQLLVANGNASTATAWTNWDGTLLGPSKNLKLKLGNPANISITGGSSGQYLSTDGTGNLSWSTASAGSLGVADAEGWLHNNGTGTLVWSSPTNVFYGTSKVDVINNSNVTVTVGGTANIATFTTTDITLKANIDIKLSGTASEVSGANLISGTFLTGTLTTGYQPNITGVGTLANLTVTGNATVGTLIVTVATAPAHSYGAVGDRKGTIAFDDDYMYYCRRNYADDATDIWSRVAMSQSPF
jgi:hypothetical protein